jgi:hypothetical protein
MASPELDRERELFFASLQLPEPERRAYLDRTCGDDGPLRQRLENLLQAHAKATSEFASLAVSPADIRFSRNLRMTGVEETLCNFDRCPPCYFPPWQSLPWT